MPSKAGTVPVQTPCGDRRPYACTTDVQRMYNGCTTDVRRLYKGCPREQHARTPQPYPEHHASTSGVPRPGRGKDTGNTSDKSNHIIVRAICPIGSQTARRI